MVEVVVVDGFGRRGHAGGCGEFVMVGVASGFMGVE